MSDDHSNIERLLGQLLADRERATEDRQELREGISTIHRRLDALVPLPALVTAHEVKDDERHIDNTARLDTLAKEIADLKLWRSGREGERKGVDAIAKAIWGFIGALIAGLAAWLKFRGN